MYESIDDICDFEVRMHSCSTRGNKQGCIISGEERYMVVKVIEIKKCSNGELYVYAF